MGEKKVKTMSFDDFKHNKLGIQLIITWWLVRYEIGGLYHLIPPGLMRIVKTKLTLEWRTLFCSNMFQGRTEVWVVSWAKALPVGSAGSGKVWILKTAWGAFGEGCTQVQSYHQGKVVAVLLVSFCSPRFKNKTLDAQMTSLTFISLGCWVFLRVPPNLEV